MICAYPLLFSLFAAIEFLFLKRMKSLQGQCCHLSLVLLIQIFVLLYLFVHFFFSSKMACGII